jgi:hypothetical protein
MLDPQAAPTSLMFGQLHKSFLHCIEYDVVRSVTYTVYVLRTEEQSVHEEDAAWIGNSQLATPIRVRAFESQRKTTRTIDRPKFLNVHSAQIP